MEGHLYVGVTDLLAKSASLTAELMAARLEQVAASGSSLVSEVSATVAAGRGKVTVALSRFHTYFFLLYSVWYLVIDQKVADTFLATRNLNISH
jgi:hypothetical protein